MMVGDWDVAFAFRCTLGLCTCNLYVECALRNCLAVDLPFSSGKKEDERIRLLSTTGVFLIICGKISEPWPSDIFDSCGGGMFCIFFRNF